MVSGSKKPASFLPKIGYWDGLEGHLHNLRHVKSKLSSMRQFHTVLGVDQPHKDLCGAFM